MVHKNFERVVQDLQAAKEKCDELRASKQDAVRELLTIQEQHRAELRISGNALQEEINAREAGERRLCELRGEVGRGLLLVMNLFKQFIFAAGTDAIRECGRVGEEGTLGERYFGVGEGQQEVTG